MAVGAHKPPSPSSLFPKKTIKAEELEKRLIVTREIWREPDVTSAVIGPQGHHAM